MKQNSKILLLIISAIALQGCVKRISPYNKKQRKLHEVEVMHKEKTLSHDSLWTERASSTSMFSEKKAHKINDIILVMIEESDTAKKSAQTNLDRSGSTEFGIDNGFGIWERFIAKNTNIDKSNLFKAGYSHEFEGAGDTSRNEHMQAALTVVVKKVYSSGNLFIEGDKVTMVNGEEQHLYVSGIIRPEDISNDNTVRSDRIAELQIEFTGRGVVSDKQQPGFFTRVLDWIWPF